MQINKCTNHTHCILHFYSLGKQTNKKRLFQNQNEGNAQNLRICFSREKSVDWHYSDYTYLFECLFVLYQKTRWLYEIIEINIYLSVCLYVCMYLPAYLCVYLLLSIYMYIYMYFSSVATVIWRCIWYPVLVGTSWFWWLVRWVLVFADQETEKI